MPRKKKTETISPEIIQDLLDRPFKAEVDPPTTLWEALQLMNQLSTHINEYLTQSPLVQDYALLHASRIGKTQGRFQLNFSPTIDFVGMGRSTNTTQKAKTKTTPKQKATPKETPKKEEKKLTPLELLWEKAEKMKIDISDIKENEKAIKDRISVWEEMAVDTTDEDSQEEIIVIDHNRKKRAPRVRTHSIASINQTSRPLSGLGNILGTLQEKSLDSISAYVSNKNGLDDETK
tara:strand:- start:36 stop:737 length:702 start_codon:yes stop_codon:yes gene_type:complete